MNLNEFEMNKNGQQEIELMKLKKNEILNKNGS